MNAFIYGGISRVSSTQTFAQYKESESYNHSQQVVNKNGVLLDYETLELRVHPPNINIKIEESETLITLDSANKPGTLIEVVQCLTELGLSFTKARVTSDGGWFVDEFYVHDSNGPVKDTKKLAAIERVLNINFDSENAQLAASGMQGGSCTVLEISGSDRTGLLADLMAAFSSVNCTVWSASIWTSKSGRATFVLGVNDEGQPLSEANNWTLLHDRLLGLLGGAAASARVTRDSVEHPALVHHERRLHKLMLAEEMRQYESEHGRELSRSGSASSLLGEVLSMEGGSNESAATPDLSDDPRQPDVKVTFAPARKYWFVRLICHDRNKLLFDLVCTFVDLDFDIYHATLDVEARAGLHKATMEFYVRPRLGGPDYDVVQGRRLADMLRASILRRLPKGLKLHVQTHESVGQQSDLGQLTKKLVDAGLTITRASVKPSRASKGCADHTLYLVDEQGDLPQRRVVEAACEELRAASGVAGRKAFSFSCFERNWRRDWGVGSDSSSSSKALIYEETIDEG